MKKLTPSATEKGMLITIVLLGMLVALRWGHIRKRVTDGMNYLKPADTTVVNNEQLRIESGE